MSGASSDGRPPCRPWIEGRAHPATAGRHTGGNPEGKEGRSAHRPPGPPEMKPIAGYTLPGPLTLLAVCADAGRAALTINDGAPGSTAVFFAHAGSLTGGP